jgi:hypothetical protein
LKSEVGDVRQTFAGLIKRGFQEKVLSCDGILPDSNSIASGKVVADLKYGKNLDCRWRAFLPGRTGANRAFELLNSAVIQTQ